MTIDYVIYEGDGTESTPMAIGSEEALLTMFQECDVSGVTLGDDSITLELEKTGMLTDEDHTGYDIIISEL